MAKASLSIKVKRGPESWAFIYIFLGFALTIESTVVTMVPLQWPCNVLAFGAVAAASTWAFLGWGWFQNKLIGIKTKYEGAER